MQQDHDPRLAMKEEIKTFCEKNGYKSADFDDLFGITSTKRSNWTRSSGTIPTTIELGRIERIQRSPRGMALKYHLNVYYILTGFRSTLEAKQHLEDGKLQKRVIKEQTRELEQLKQELKQYEAKE